MPLAFTQEDVLVLSNWISFDGRVLVAPVVVAEMEGTITLEGECTAELLNKESDEYKSLARNLTLEVCVT